jgi:hypothetical protein
MAIRKTKTVYIARYRTNVKEPWDRVTPRGNPKGEFATRKIAEEALERAKANNKKVKGHVAAIKVSRKEPVKIDDWLIGDVVPIRSVPAKYRDDYRDTLQKTAEAAASINHVLYVSDSFRPRALQEQRYREYLAGGPLAAKPGTSDHERGLSLDIPNARDNKKLMKALKKRKMIDDVRSEKWHITNIGRKYG